MDPVTVLYEDDEVLVVNKPAGLVVHADGRTEEPTLVDWLLEKYPAIQGVGEAIKVQSSKLKAQSEDRGGDDDEVIIERSGIVHRLDRETSGAIVIAKTRESYLHLKRQFQDREVHKKYHLFVWGEMKTERGTIDRPIGKSPNDFRQWSAQRGAKGVMREAVTWYKVLARGHGISFIEAQPQTGRTHQIRVHFKAIGNPVVGDKLYAPTKRTALGFERTALHARSIKFMGRGGKEIEVVAPYPDDFTHALELLK
ncbi:MAG TPA: RluA family pseudouridine synthase [Candidatus Paceibacterota bacterium]